MYGAGHNFAGRSRIFIYQDNETSFLEVSGTLGEEIAATGGTSFGIDNQFLLPEKLVGKVYGCIQIASAVSLQVEDQVFHAFLLELFQRLCKFFGGSSGKTVDTYIPCLGLYHVGCIQAEDGNLVTFYGEVQCVVHAAPYNGKFDFRVFRAAQPCHDILRTHLDSGDGAVVDCHDTVSGKDAHFFGRPVAYGLYHEQGIFYHLELYADTLEITLQGLVHFLYLFCIVIGRMRIELCQHFNDGFFHQFVFVHLIYI